jgi:D-cysteine desulfhydrase family pyridoxal phosphate-dependent enzyme
MLTDRVPRVRLAQLPTPIEELPRLSRALGGPRILAKRDDLTGLAGGGNKTRKLEFSLGEALRQEADTLVTLGAVQSNHARQTAAAAARCGLRCVLVLSGGPPRAENGNLLLDRLLGAEVVFAGARTREEVAAEAVAAERAAGRRPFLIPVGASDEIGAVGYVAAAEELAAQLEAQRLRVDRIVFASSSFGTQAGLCLGVKALGLGAQIAGVAIDAPRAEVQAQVAALAGRTARRLGLDVAIDPGAVIAFDGYLGGGYAVLGDAEREAIALVARQEGLLLDPVYTGRAMAGLVDLVRKKAFGAGETILFWHTGGTPALHAYAEGLLGR